MANTDERAERLAAQLRANLLRRKAQAREAAGAGASAGGEPRTPAADPPDTGTPE